MSSAPNITGTKRAAPDQTSDSPALKIPKTQPSDLEVNMSANGDGPPNPPAAAAAAGMDRTMQYRTAVAGLKAIIDAQKDPNDPQRREAELQLEAMVEQLRQMTHRQQQARAQAAMSAAGGGGGGPQGHGPGGQPPQVQRSGTTLAMREQIQRNPVEFANKLARQADRFQVPPGQNPDEWKRGIITKIVQIGAKLDAAKKKIQMLADPNAAQKSGETQEAIREQQVQTQTTFKYWMEVLEKFCTQQASSLMRSSSQQGPGGQPRPFGQVVGQQQQMPQQNPNAQGPPPQQQQPQMPPQQRVGTPVQAGSPPNNQMPRPPQQPNSAMSPQSNIGNMPQARPGSSAGTASSPPPHSPAPNAAQQQQRPQTAMPNPNPNVNPNVNRNLAGPASMPQGQPGTLQNQRMPIPLQLNVAPPPAVAVGPTRPTLTGGANTPYNTVLGGPAILQQPNFDFDETGNMLLSRRKLEELVKQIDPEEKLDPDVEESILEIVDEFIETVASTACRMAKLRGSDQLDIRDLQVILERNWNIRIPGYNADEVRSVRKFNPAPAYHHKMSALMAQKSLAQTGGKDL